MDRKSVWRAAPAVLAALAAAAAWAEPSGNGATLETVAQGAAGEGLAFPAAQSMMREGSDLLRASEAQAVAKEKDAEADKSLGQPKVTFSTKMIWGSKTLDYGTLSVGSSIAGAAQRYPGLGAVLQSLPAKARSELAGLKIPLHYKTDIDGPRMTLAGYWLLYTGGQISAKQEAGEAAAREARDDLRRDADALDRDLAQKYFGVQLCRAVTKLREDALADQEREVARAKGFEHAGTLSRLERMSVEVNRDKAKRDLLAARADEKVAVAELSRLLKEKDIGSLATPLFVLKGSVGPLESWQDAALASSPVLAAYGAKTEQAGALVKAAKGAYHPTVYAFGEKNLIKNYLTIPEPDWAAGVGVSFTLWNNRDRAAALASARATKERAEAGAAEARSQVLSGVEVAWLRTTQMQDQYELTRSTVALAEENLRMREAAFASGLSTANEVWDARTKVTGAKVEQKVAAYKFVVAWAALNSAAGTMEKFNESIAGPGRAVEQ